MGAQDWGRVPAGLPTQATRLLRLRTPLGGDLLIPEAFDGVETVFPRGGFGAPAGLPAAGFRWTVQAVSPRADLDLSALLGQSLRLDLLGADHALRPFHGLVTRCSALGSDGGLARYELVAEPWLAVLAHRRDSYLFQNLSVPDILAEVFADYAGQGALQPAWRFDLAELGAYPPRSLCIQHEESDLDFVLRLLAEEGLVAWFEHAADGHTLIVADHDGATAPCADQAARGCIRYTQAGPTLAEDSLQGYVQRVAVAASRVVLASWDYRSLSQRPAEDQVAVAAAAGSGAPLPPLLQFDQPGAYAYDDPAQGERLARRRREGLTTWAHLGRIHGTVRSLAPMTWFDLAGHPAPGPAAGAPDGRARLRVLSMRHEARNNLHANEPDADKRDADTRDTGAPTFLYRNQGEVLPADLPVRPLFGPHAWAQRPNAPGVQTAIVVGLGEPAHTDRDHRIKIQFHWQRGDRSSARLEHPAASNAPASDASGTWVRVAESLAGPNWGAHFTPRLGQEVLVDFVEGDIDRPVVIGSLYNGAGQVQAQGNQVAQGAAGATGSAPMWFPGTQRYQAAAASMQGHAHPASLSGVQTQELQASARGGGGHNRFVLDDTPGAGRIQLASSTQPTGARATHLSIGHLLHQHGNQRLQSRGHGLELFTPHWGALRAGAALQLSTHARSGGTTQATGHQMDSTEAQARLQRGAELQAVLSRSAQAQGACLPNEAADLPATTGLRETVASLRTQAYRGTSVGSTPDRSRAPNPHDPQHATPAAPPPGGQGRTPAPAQPELLLTSPAGILATTPAHTVAAALGTASLSSAQDINHTAQRHHAVAARSGIVAYTVGQAPDPHKPQAESGLRAHSATGRNSLQAQSAAMHWNADGRVSLDSTQASVRLSAPKHLLLTGAGSYLRLSGGNIELGTSGPAEFKGAMKELAGAAQAPTTTRALRKAAPLKICEFRAGAAANGGDALVTLP